MNMTGVHGIWRAIKDAEEKPLIDRKHEALRQHKEEYLRLRAKATQAPVQLSKRVRRLSSELSIADECQLSGVTIMKRIHCLMRQIGSVDRPVKRYLLTDEGDNLGPNYRFKPCFNCRHWLDEQEYSQARQLLAACAGDWDEFLKAAGSKSRMEAA